MTAELSEHDISCSHSYRNAPFFMKYTMCHRNIQIKCHPEAIVIVDSQVSHTRVKTDLDVLFPRMPIIRSDNQMR